MLYAFIHSIVRKCVLADPTIQLHSFGHLIERSGATPSVLTLLTGNGFSNHLGLSFSSSAINAAARQYQLGRRATQLLKRIPHIMPEDALRYLRGYPLTHIASRSETSEYRVLRYALLRAIVDVHPDTPYLLTSGASAPGALGASAEFFQKFSAVYTTNYDRLTYWATAQYPIRRFFTDRFAEYVTSDEDVNVPTHFYHRTHYPNRIPILYLHGALHFYHWQGTTTKLQRSAELGSLGQQIRERLAAGLEPEIILEGSAKRKMRQIKQSFYLSDIYDTFQGVSGILVTYGWGFNLQDRHLVDAILRNQNLTEIWISVYEDVDSEENREMRARIDRRRAKAEQLGLATPAKIIYYDADLVPF